MELACTHNICLPCVNALGLAEATDCPICTKPMGTPMTNHLLAQIVAEVFPLPVPFL